MIESTGERRRWPLRGDERDGENSSGGKKWRESGTQREAHNRFSSVSSSLFDFV